MTVETLQELEALKPEDVSPKDDMIYCRETSKIYHFNEEGKIENIALSGEPLKLNNYEMNKQIVAQLTPMDDIKIQQKTQMLNTFFNDTRNTFYMLLCKEYNYYTLFVKEKNGTNKNFGKIVVEILQEFNGEIYAIDKVDSAVEIWIKPQNETEPYVFYLFGYDRGVVYYDWDLCRYGQYVWLLL